MLGAMIELKHIKSEEVRTFPHRTDPLKVARVRSASVGAIRGRRVIFRGSVRQIMLLAEAAKAAGVFESGSVMGRPTCAMVPQSISTSTGSPASAASATASTQCSAR